MSSEKFSKICGRPFTVLLTGGIASGKTTVSDMFQYLGVPVIDADLIAREIVTPGQPALKKIANLFGDSFILPDGNLDRSKMRQKMVTDPSLRSRLESIMHPAIEDQIFSKIRKMKTTYCLLVIPLFVESKSYQWVDRVLLIDVSEEIQLERLAIRDHMDESEAKALIALQATRQERIAVADDILNNAGDKADLLIKVIQLHKKYISLASEIAVR